LHVVNNFDSLAALYSHLDDINLLDADRLRPSWDSYFMVGLASVLLTVIREMTNQPRH
jgi:hypothetical protein